MEIDWEVKIKSRFCPYRDHRVSKRSGNLLIICREAERRESLKPTIDGQVLHPQSTECREKLCPHKTMAAEAMVLRCDNCGEDLTIDHSGEFEGKTYHLLQPCFKCTDVDILENYKKH